MCVQYVQASPEEHSLGFLAGSGISFVGCLRDKTQGFELFECSEGLGVFCRKPTYAALSPPGPRFHRLGRSLSLESSSENEKDGF